MNHRFLLASIVFQLCLAVLIVYVPPLNVVFTTQVLPVHVLYVLL